MSTVLSYQIRPARQGIRWLQQATLLFGRGRLMWLALVILYWIIAGFVRLVPVLGGPLTLVLQPVFMVGFIAAAWHTARGEDISIEHLFAGFRSNLYALLAVGGLLLVSFFGIFFCSQLFDGGHLFNLVVKGTPLPEGEAAGASVTAAMLFVIVGFMALVPAFWFAPALIVFDEYGALRAIRLSLAAGLANWRSFLAFFAVFFLIPLPVAMVSTVLSMLGDIGAALGTLLLLAVFLAVFPLQAASIFTSYIDVFHSDEPLSIRDPAGPSND